MNGIFEIRLEAERSDSGFRACWFAETGQPAEPFELDLPWTAVDAAGLSWYLEKFRGFVGAGTRVKARAVERQLKESGRRLFDTCFGGPQGAKALGVFGAAVAAAKPLTLSLASDESLFHQVPWELMRDASGPLVFQGVSIRRQLISEECPRLPRQAAPLRLLLIVPRPDDTGFLDPRSSQGPLLDALEMLPEGAVRLDLCQPPTVARLEEMVEKARTDGRPYHIVHFDGHGTFLPLTGVGVVCFEQNDRYMHRVPGRDFGKLLARLEIPLVILEACRTSSLSDAPVHGSVAPALLASGVGSVVAFSHNVSLDASRLLVERFYRELAAGRAVGQALAGAREALRAHPERRIHAGRNASTVDFEDWFLPQLYQLSVDPVLVTGTAATSEVVAKPRPEERLRGFPPQPMYRFQGRAWELLQIERALEKFPAVVLAGGGGMGKTALAREAAWWWLRTRRFELAVFVSFEQVTTVQRVVQELGRAFEGVIFCSRPAEDQRKIALQLFRDNRILLVWDNFESTLPQFQLGDEGGIVSYPEEERTQLRTFYEELTGYSGEGRLLVTCRPGNTDLSGIGRLALGGLARPDSLHLIQAIADARSIDLERPGWEREEVELLLDLLADHPLSISLVGPHLEKLSPGGIRSNFADLLDQFEAQSEEDSKNRSLRASLAFSTSRLSGAAQAILPFLAWFQGGAFENIVLTFAKLAPEAWLPLRTELQATALLRPEELPGFLVPFLRFHPTLPYAARRDRVGDLQEAEQHYVAIYLDVIRQVDAIFRSKNSRQGQILAEREELNIRSSLEMALRVEGAQQACRELAGTLGNFLQMSGRFHEKNQLADWIQARILTSDGPLDIASRAAIQQHARSLASRGRASEAADRLRKLISRLEAEELADSDSLLDLGTSYSFLGQIWTNANKPNLAVAPCQRAISILKSFPEGIGQDRLAEALGTLANAYRALGHPDKALEAAERGLAIDRKLGGDRNMAAGLGQCAAILSWQQRWTEADERYQEVFNLALRLGDLELQAITLQHQGGLQDDQGNPGRAAELYQRAITFFQWAGNTQGEMQTYSLLATAERRRGELDAAEAWYGRARELATQLADQHQVAEIAHNIAILYQDRAEKATSAGERQQWLQQSLIALQESLKIELTEENQVGAAKTYFQRGVVYKLLGDFENAEKASREALKIHVGADDPETWKIYHNLVEIAAARGDVLAAQQWAAVREATLAEIEKRHGSPKGSALSIEGLRALNEAIYSALGSRSDLEPQAAEDIEALIRQPWPLEEVGRFLKVVAMGDLPPSIPTGLPEGLRQTLRDFAQAVAELPRMSSSGSRAATSTATCPPRWTGACEPG